MLRKLRAWLEARRRARFRRLLAEARTARAERALAVIRGARLWRGPLFVARVGPSWAVFATRGCAHVRDLGGYATFGEAVRRMNALDSLNYRKAS